MFALTVLNKYPAQEFLKQQLDPILKKSLLFVSAIKLSTWLFTHPNSLTSPETIRIRIHHDPTLLPSPGVTLFPNFSGNVLASYTVQTGEHYLCASPTASLFPPETSSIQVSPGAVVAFPPVAAEGAAESQLLIWLSSKAPAASANPGGRHQAGHCSSLGPCTGPRDLTVAMQSPYLLFFKVLYNVAFQTSYNVEFHWLFTLFFRRSARCPSWVHEQVVGSAPTYITPIIPIFSISYFFIVWTQGSTGSQIPTSFIE